MLTGRGLLTEIQRQALTFFATLPDQERFYLAGGTALAEFYLGHRLSFDLDLFTSEAGLIMPFSHLLETGGQQQGLQIVATRRFASLVELVLSSGQETLRVDLALDSPFRFEPPVLSTHGVYVSGFTDLQADKALAYYGRAEPRDAVDLYFLIDRAGRQALLDLAARKDPGFDLYWFAVALSRAAAFPDELERWPVKMLVELLPTHLKEVFLDWALDLMSAITAEGQV
jgi:hypothetical protein